MKEGQYIESEIFEEDTKKLYRTWERNPGSHGSVVG
jgi:hypothetical protein